MAKSQRLRIRSGEVENGVRGGIEGVGPPFSWGWLCRRVAWKVLQPTTQSPNIFPTAKTVFGSDPISWNFIIWVIYGHPLDPYTNEGEFWQILHSRQLKAVPLVVACVRSQLSVRAIICKRITTSTSRQTELATGTLQVSDSRRAQRSCRPWRKPTGSVTITHV